MTIADDLTLEQQNNRRQLIKEANELNEKEKETESDIKHVVRTYNRYSKNHFIKMLKPPEKKDQTDKYNVYY